MKYFYTQLINSCHILALSAVVLIVISALFFSSTIVDARPEQSAKANKMDRNDLAPLLDVTQVAVGGFHTCVLLNRADIGSDELTGGGVQCWGRNGSGQLGDETITYRATPVDVKGLQTDISSIAAGSFHTCALTTSGNVKCWGTNSAGQLGVSGPHYSSAPVDVSGLNNITAISARANYTCAITDVGAVTCWGENGSGQLGDGTTTDSSIPVGVSGLSTGVTAISTGRFHTCGVMSSGGVKCWGKNTYRQLGDGTTTHSLTPVDVLGLTGSVQSVAVGETHTCALTTNGGARCWGGDGSGQIGNGTTASVPAPVDVNGLTGGVAALVAGAHHTCALVVTGGVKCWGKNSVGQIGDGTLLSRSSPTDVSGLGSAVTAISAGFGNTCAVMSSGGVKCWGDNIYGQLGDGGAISSNVPIDGTGLISDVLTISTGGTHSCAIKSGGGVYCWGGNDRAQLGDGTKSGRSTPVSVNNLSSGTSTIDLGTNHTCALTIAGSLLCWGDNIYGQLGDGTKTDRTVPSPVNSLSTGVTALSVGGDHACALTSAGGVKCWGRNSDGQLGDGTSESRTVPTDVNGLTSGVASIWVGVRHTCALLNAGGAKCWGYNNFGQLGDGSTTDSFTPVDVNGLDEEVLALSLGWSYTCALMNSGGVNCWGANSSGQLGDGTTDTRGEPRDVSGLSSGMNAISAGDYHVCANSNEGLLYCWGSNQYGQIGDATGTANHFVPFEVTSLSSPPLAISSGVDHTCAVVHSSDDGDESSGHVTCWGDDRFGQLGTGRLLYSAVPIDVMTIPCYTLSLSHSGNGAALSVFPVQSEGCDAGQYTQGVEVTLSATPASGWSVSGWSGTSDDSSTMTNNRLVMPASDHSASVIYGENPPAATPTATDLPTDAPTDLPTSTSSSTPVTSATPTATVDDRPTGTPTAPATGDAYESDNSCQTAKSIPTDGSIQEHTYHRPADVDWVSFTVTANRTYRIEAQPQVDSQADISLELYTSCETRPDEEESETFTPGVRLDFTPTQDGPIYLKLFNTNPNVGDPGMAYQVGVKILAEEPVRGSVIIVAGRLKLNDPLQQNIHNVTNTVFDLFQANGYSAEDIYYLATDPSLTGYDASATTNNLRDTIVSWAKDRLMSDQALTLYIMDHGERDVLYIDEVNQERLTPAQLDEWLTEVEEAVPGVKVNVIVEACYAGSFIEGIQSVSKEGRVVIASSSPEWSAYASRYGAHFSDHFLTSLRQGTDLFQSFWWTRQVVSRYYPKQEPWLDANGNSIPNEVEDAAIAATRGFAYQGTLPGEEPWPPYIVQATPPTISGTSGTLQAEVRDNRSVDSVWAVVYRPSYQEITNDRELVAETLEKLILDPQGNNQFSVTYNGFTESGTYRFVIHAEDGDGLEGMPLILEVEHGDSQERELYLPLVGE
ncbi:MAG: C13 family peptidase [Chloroflexota bacterium]